MSSASTEPWDPWPSAARHTLHPFKPRPLGSNVAFKHNKHSDLTSQQTVCFPHPDLILLHFFSFHSLFYLFVSRANWEAEIWNMSWILEWAPARKQAVTASGNPCAQSALLFLKWPLHTPADVCVCFGDVETLNKHSNNLVHECIYLFCLKVMVLWES